MNITQGRLTFIDQDRNEGSAREISEKEQSQSVKYTVCSERQPGEIVALSF